MVLQCMNHIPCGIKILDGFDSLNFPKNDLIEAKHHRQIHHHLKVYQQPKNTIWFGVTRMRTFVLLRPCSTGNAFSYATEI